MSDESEFTEFARKLGRLRWKDVSAEDRSAHATEMANERWKDSTDEERTAAGRAAAKARWAKAKTAQPAKKKAVKKAVGKKEKKA